MAFGDNNNSNKVFDPTYYGKSYVSDYDNGTGVEFSYSGGLMKLSMFKRDAGNSGRKEEIISASLTGLKAHLLVEAMNKLDSDVKDGNAEGHVYGITSGMGETVKVVGFGVEDGKKYFVIAKVNSQGGMSEKTVYKFTSGVNYYMDWSNFDSMKYSRIHDDEVEYIMFKNALADFSRNISGAAGYATLFMNKYEHNKDMNKINQIMDKLGISIKTNNASYDRSANNFFSNNNSVGNTNSEHKTYSDIEEMLGGGDD